METYEDLIKGVIVIKIKRKLHPYFNNNGMLFPGEIFYIESTYDGEPLLNYWKDRLKSKAIEVIGDFKEYVAREGYFWRKDMTHIAPEYTY